MLGAVGKRAGDHLGEPGWSRHQNTQTERLTTTKENAPNKTAQTQLLLHYATARAPAGTVLVPPRLDLADLPLPRAVVLGPQVRWSFTGRDEQPCGGADADGRLPVPVRRVAAAGARRLPALELHVAVRLAVGGDLAQPAPFAMTPGARWV